MKPKKSFNWKRKSSSIFHPFVGSNNMSIFGWFLFKRESQPGGFCALEILERRCRLRTRFEILVTEFFQAKVSGGSWESWGAGHGAADTFSRLVVKDFWIHSDVFDVWVVVFLLVRNFFWVDTFTKNTPTSLILTRIKPRKPHKRHQFKTPSPEAHVSGLFKWDPYWGIKQSASVW